MLLPGLVLAGVLVGYLAIYVVTFQELSWHLETSMRRLLLHLWPAFLLVLFVAARTPAEALRRYSTA